MQVTIAFAAPSGLWRQQLQVPADTTVGEALSLSAFAREFPEFTDHLPVLGVYGERCERSRLLHDGDRVELYRPLVFDPQESRRRRALHRKSQAGRPRRGG